VREQVGPRSRRDQWREQLGGQRREGRSDRRSERRESARDRESRAARLDVPKETRRLIRRPRFEDDTFGRFAERFARFMGTASFLLYMTGFVVLWIVWNWVAPDDSTWDAYPFIFLTLMLSLQASYAAPLILLAQNRHEDRDRVIAEGDRLANSRAHADMEFLAREMASLRMALGEVATRDYVRSELRSLLGEIEELRQRERDREGREEGDSGAGEHAVEGNVG
jgi:uncharacterized membrane protein